MLSCILPKWSKGENILSHETVVADTLSQPVRHTISLLVVPSLEEHIWTIYGHAAVRVVSSDGQDRVYNWGIFDFEAPGFIPRFVAGTSTDYMLAEQPTEQYIYNYTSDGCEVSELVLNLSQEEAEHFLSLVEENLKPENRFYHYDFVFDNCATRPIVLLEKSLQGRLILPKNTPTTTRRTMVDQSSKQRPWLKFGTDMVLGTPADTPIEAHDQLFLPIYMRNIIREAQFEDTAGNVRQAVIAEQTYPQLKEQEPLKSTPWVFQPFAVCLYLLLITLIGALTARGKAYFMRTWSAIMLGVMGLAGCLTFFLTVISLHPLTAPNWTLVSIHPLHFFLGLPLLLFFRNSLVAHLYHYINILLQLLFLLVLSWSTGQHFSPSLYMLSAALLLISFWVSRYNKLLPRTTPRLRIKKQQYA